MTESDRAHGDQLRILLDVSLAYHSVGRIPFGMLRVERHLIHGALKTNDVSIDFCSYDKMTNRYYSVSRSDIAFAITFENPSRIRRLAGRRNIFRDAWEFVTSRSSRRYCFLRWNLLRFIPVRRLSGRLDEETLDAATIFTILTYPRHIEAISELKRRTQMSLFVLCHDIIPMIHPEYFETHTVTHFRNFVETLLLPADGIGAVSESTRRDIEDYARSIGKEIPTVAVTTLGTELTVESPAMRPASLPALDPCGYILCVGNINARKNHELLYRVWAGMEIQRPERVPPLVIAGEVGWMPDKLLDRIKADPRTRNSILFLHDVDDLSLAWLYRNCLFTVYPSFYEGWGLPVSESLAHGKYCLTSTTSSLPEAGATFAGLIDPRDFQAWEKEIISLIDNDTILEQLENRIRNGFRPLTWRSAADAVFKQAQTVKRLPADASRPSVNLP